MNIIKVQSVIFCITALLVTLLSSKIESMSGQLELIILSILILILGVPHGSLDTILAAKLYNIQSIVDWVKFTLFYIGSVAFIVLLWFFVPTVFLLGFLIISIIHFSGDLLPDIKLPVRIFYGGCVIVLPFILHANEVSRLFQMLVGDKAALNIVPLIKLMCWPWLIGIIITLILNKSNNIYSWFEVIAVILLAIFSQPLIAFTIFFCCMHSARHIIRSLEGVTKSSYLFILIASFLPMLGVLIFSSIAWFFFKNINIETRIIQIVFVGLAALTVPHMFIVEQLRLKNVSNN
jgi:beta-carotene 15,15'-dioxygenase